MFKPELAAPAPGAGKPVVERETASRPSSRATSPRHARPDQSRGPRLRKAKGGVASVGVYDTSTSVGQLAFMEQSRGEGPHRHHHGELAGVRRRQGRRKASFGTNPLCFACPVEGRSSVCVRHEHGGHRAVRRLDVQGQGPAVPPSRLTTQRNWTRKVEDIHIGGGGGAIANFGGHKGTGLALMVELLCAALAGGAVLGQDVKKTAKNWGHHVIAIDPTPWPTASRGGRPASSRPSRRRTRRRGLPGDSSNAIAAKNKNGGPSPCPSASGTSSRRRRPSPVA